MSTASIPHRVGPSEITELLARCQGLSAAGPDADPAERAAYLAAKTDLLARITDPDPHTSRHDHGDQREEQR